jgi:aspartate kinase
MKTIFAALATLNIRVNLMQNTALSCSLCLDDNPLLLAQLRDQLQGQFLLRYNQGLQLITIRYYTQDIIDRIVGSRTILLQQRTRTTTQLIIQ